MDNKKILEQVEVILNEKIRPALKLHAGGIEVIKFDDKTRTLFVKMEGTCVGCGFAEDTLYGFVEEEIRTNIPDIENVEPVDFGEFEENDLGAGSFED